MNEDMNYDPSHRTPPRQDRWPNATPREGWPAYSARDDHVQAADHRSAYGGYGGTAGGYGGTAGGYDGGAGYGYYRNGNGYAPAGYGGTWDGGYGDRDGYQGTADDFYPADRDGGPDPRTGYLDQGGYVDQGDYLEPLPSGVLLVAPDAFGDPGWGPARSRARDRDAGRGGLIVGAVTGFLAAAVAIGAATLAAAFVRPQASPIIAVGGAFIDRTPSAVKNFAVEHFGENDKTMLLLGMYVAIAILAMVIGCLARRNATIGVGGLAAFGLFGAFVAITRPESQPTDVIPSVVGGLAGIAAYAWLAHASAPVAAVRHAHGGGRRRLR